VPTDSADEIIRIERDYHLEALEFKGDWLRVRLKTPSDYCLEPDEVRTEEGWIRPGRPDSTGFGAPTHNRAAPAVPRLPAHRVVSNTRIAPMPVSSESSALPRIAPESASRVRMAWPGVGEVKSGSPGRISP